ncbi:MAG TPA: lipoprotein insertase outer membrane protein LolB [Gammaproteobacteria bacterium]|nr:lipoprotein insertase outer membrane protein LolB [Gammaproteobacteria bacterium]
MKPAVALLAALTAFAAGGCAHLRDKEPGAPAVAGSDGLTYDARRARLTAVDAWETSGRLAVDTGERGFQGSFRWQQHGDELELVVRGAPLRTVVLQVAGTSKSLTVTARGDDPRVLDDPETQLSELLGWWLPVTSLRAWLLGFPDPQFPATTAPGTEGTLASFEQRLWNVSYVSYQLGAGRSAAAPSSGDAGAAGALLLPRRIDMKHGELGVRLTIDDWHPSAP